jgi:hypothetical protein
MKLNEIATAPGHDFKRQHMLQLMLKNGEQPEIVNASYVRGHFSWGDLKALGYAKQGHHPIRDGYEAWWTYTGPGSIAVITRGKTENSKEVLHSGESTSPVPVYVD